MKIFGFVKKSIFTGFERSEIVNVSNDNPIFYPFSVKTSKCSGNCNNRMTHTQKYVLLML